MFLIKKEGKGLKWNSKYWENTNSRTTKILSFDSIFKKLKTLNTLSSCFAVEFGCYFSKGFKTFVRLLVQLPLTISLNFLTFFLNPLSGNPDSATAY